MITKQKRYMLRKERTRRKIFQSGISMPRLSVFRSNKYIYAQVVDDIKGRTIACASSIEKEVRDKIKSGKNIESAKIVGNLIAKRAIEKGVKEVCFDRGGRIYHGRIKSLADAARQSGLKF